MNTEYISNNQMHNHIIHLFVDVFIDHSLFSIKTTNTCTLNDFAAFSLTCQK